jgi:hypothetical protein
MTWLNYFYEPVCWILSFQYFSFKNIKILYGHKNNFRGRYFSKKKYYKFMIWLYYFSEPVWYTLKFSILLVQKYHNYLPVLRTQQPPLESEHQPTLLLICNCIFQILTNSNSISIIYSRVSWHFFLFLMQN